MINYDKPKMLTVKPNSLIVRDWRPDTPDLESKYFIVENNMHAKHPKNCMMAVYIK